MQFFVYVNEDYYPWAKVMEAESLEAMRAKLENEAKINAVFIAPMEHVIWLGPEWDAEPILNPDYRL